MLAREADPTEFISIEVTNIGYGPTYVEGLFWKIRVVRARRNFFLVPTNSPCSGTIPCVLKEGERTNFLFDPDNLKKNAIPSVRDALGKFPKPSRSSAHWFWSTLPSEKAFHAIPRRSCETGLKARSGRDRSKACRCFIL